MSTAVSPAEVRPLLWPQGEGRGSADKRFFALLLAATVLPIAWLTLAGLPPLAGAVPAWATALLIWLGGSGHVAGSFAFYFEPQARAFMIRERPGRFVWAPLGVIAVVALAFATVHEAAVTAALVLVYWTWQVHHYSRQNMGVLAFLARAERRPVTPAELRALQLTDLAGITASLPFLREFGVSMAAPWGAWLHGAGAVFFIAAICVWLAERIRSGGQSRARDLGMVVLLLFYLPLFLFDSFPLAVTGFATAHGVQYFLFLGCVARVPRDRQIRALAALAGCTLVLGAVLFLSGLSARGAFYGAGLGVVMAHFVIDAGMWRLREPFQRAYMAERFSFL